MDFHERRLEEDPLRGLLDEARGIVAGSLKREGTDRKLSDELGRLSDYLEAISSKLKTAEVEIEGASTQIPQETDQLTGVTRFTEQEVHRVLGYAERALSSHDKLVTQWEALKGELHGEIDSRRQRRCDELVTALEEEKRNLMDLITALSFQDVAAQWLQKISSDMNGVQSRIKKLNGAFKPKGIEAGRPTAPEKGGAPDSFSKAAARFSRADKLAQTDVDRLLKEHGR